MKKNSLILLIGGINLFVLIICSISYWFLPTEIPIWYGLPSGINQLGRTFTIFVPTTLSTFFFLVNIIITKKITDRFLIQSLQISSLVISILSAYTTLRIILLIV